MPSTASLLPAGVLGVLGALGPVPAWIAPVPGLPDPFPEQGQT